MGEYGVGLLANSLSLGCDCLGEIHYFDGLVNDGDGNPVTMANAQRTVDVTAARYWKVVNPDVVNLVGRPVAYKLLPGHTAVPLAHPESRHAARGRFASRQLWVTQHDDRERFAAGRYPNQSAGDDGLPRYVAADRSLVETDVVLWYSFGAHHVVRPEDWPVMPVARIGFELKPDGFFDGNPALDLPPSTPMCHNPQPGGDGESKSSATCCS